MLSLAAEAKYYCSECNVRVLYLCDNQFYIESLLVPNKRLPNAQEARRAMVDEFELSQSYSEVGELCELLAVPAAVAN